MSKLALTLSLLVAACGGPPRITATPAQRAAALQLFVCGSSTDEVAEQLALPPREARELIHTTLLDLNRRYYRRR